MALRIQIETIPHSEQRYNTVGDWYYLPDATWMFKISSLGDWRMEVCVAIHELVECAICRFLGTSQQVVDQFDTEYEANRKPGDVSEPGDSANAPYRFAHCIATGVERVVAGVIGVSWKEYEDKINSL